MDTEPAAALPVTVHTLRQLFLNLLTQTQYIADYQIRPSPAVMVGHSVP